MARIRTIKPEAFTSESLASVSLTAERTFFGLLTQADDHGRHRDHPAVIAGALWPLRPEHTPLDVEDDLAQLATAGLICRYTGHDGKPYLHITGWHRHQKINRPSGTRHPACPTHHADGQRPGLSEGSVRTPGALPATSPHPPENRHETSPTAPGTTEAAGQSPFREGSVSSPGGFGEPSVSPHRPDPGSRILDQGSVPSGGASAPAPDTACARDLIGEYTAACASRPPAKVLGHLGHEVKQLLAEGIHPDHIRAGLERFRAKPMHPSALPSLVNEAMNAPDRPGQAPQGTGRGHRSWTDPADRHDPAAYAEEL
ncbi:hypothetical protein RKE29_13380 [Streptomyces sp. B1866]|uniref:hypothetical protein n=1 Tax=Streptomyces sp. B1866 TaxID=3075431 RepID=UPI00288E1A30|nr:hypothetical protein [Streptomyces sp. B1866]MDT3397632.1 hypothetical protein [Streptomyces sp. B1866]